MLTWLNKEGRIAIYDATNCTRSRREMVVKRCAHENIKVVFIESICTDNGLEKKYKFFFVINLFLIKISFPKISLIYFRLNLHKNMEDFLQKNHL